MQYQDRQTTLYSYPRPNETTLFVIPRSRSFQPYIVTLAKDRPSQQTFWYNRRHFARLLRDWRNAGCRLVNVSRAMYTEG
jgi:hypothetical protein